MQSIEWHNLIINVGELTHKQRFELWGVIEQIPSSVDGLEWLNVVDSALICRAVKSLAFRGDDGKVSPIAEYKFEDGGTLCLPLTPDILENLPMSLVDAISQGVGVENRYFLDQIFKKKTIPEATPTNNAST